MERDREPLEGFMTQDEVIEMAKLVIGNYAHGQYWPFFTEELEHFARLVAAKEREACWGIVSVYSSNDCRAAADAIRARGEA